MNKIPCQYAIVRFAPYVETGEFANVGIILMASKQRFFGCELIDKRYARITRFFDELDHKVFQSTMRRLREELDRTHQLLKDHDFDKRRKFNDVDFANQIFAEIIRPRETIIRFSESKIVLTENPQDTLKELYAFYVERSFVTLEYRERTLETGMYKWLTEAHVANRYVRGKIGDDEFQTTFPFVEQIEDRPAKIIKPLNLNQDNSSKILDHGGKWWFRVKELKKRRALPAPKKLVFAVDGPVNDGSRKHAYDEVVKMLTDTDATVFPYNNKEGIMDFVLHG